MVLRRVAVLALFVAALLPALDARAASPLACADPCPIAGHAVAGYTPAVTDIASGSHVQFSSSDSTHPTAEFAGAGDECFLVVASPTSIPSPVRFDLAAGALTASVADVSRACTSAHALPDGSALLTYHCRLHPNMNGILRIEPA
jgi:plastocyanin